jgi:tRNA(His) guanylyltransferase
MSTGDDLGDRMKAYEAAEDRRFAPGLPIYARIDGRSFSRFTKGMKRPYDPAMTAAMVATVKGLVADTHARIGYTQSDEISLVWLADAPGSQTFFDGRVQKLCSILGSLATAHFTAALLASDELRERASRLPHFDCRVVQLPSKVEAANMFLWRELDARKNAVSMAAQAVFSHKQLHGQGQADMLAMLAEAGVDFDAYPSSFTRGTFVRRVSFERAFTSDELERIPEGHRPAPGSILRRSEVREIDMPRFSKVANRVDVIFDGGEPSKALDLDDGAERVHSPETRATISSLPAPPGGDGEP